VLTSYYVGEKGSFFSCPGVWEFTGILLLGSLGKSLLLGQEGGGLIFCEKGLYWVQEGGKRAPGRWVFYWGREEPQLALLGRGRVF